MICNRPGCRNEVTKKRAIYCSERECRLARQREKNNRWYDRHGSRSHSSDNPTDRTMEDRFIPLADRLENALKVKAETLNMPMDWIKSTWLKGEAGQQFLGQMP